MPMFLTRETIKKAAGALSTSSASFGLGAFLVAKRAMIIGGSHHLRLSMDDESFVAAVRDVLGASDEDRSVFVDVFGVDGSAWLDDWGRPEIPKDVLTMLRKWPIFEPLDASRDDVALATGYEQHLRSLVLSKGASALQPSLVDVAIWLARSRDVASLSGGGALSNSQAAASFIGAYGIVTSEVKSIFRVPAGVGVPTLNLPAEEYAT